MASVKAWYNRPLTAYEIAMIDFMNACRDNDKEVPQDIQYHLEEIGLWKYKTIHTDMRAEIQIRLSHSTYLGDTNQWYINANLIPSDAITVFIEIVEDEEE